MPANVMDLDNFPTLLDARFTELREDLKGSVVDVISAIYTRRETDRLEERATSTGNMGSWPQFTGQIEIDQLNEQYSVTSRPREYATMTIVTRAMIHDSFFEVFNDGARVRPLMLAGMITEQEHATRLFEMINVTDSHFYVRSDGLPIASAAHTYRNSGAPTWSNTTSAPLSPVALRAALIAGRKIPSDRGKRSGITYDEIFLPVDLVPVYNEIANTPRGLDIPGLNQNQESSERTGIRNVVALDYWTSTTGWVLSNSMLKRENVFWMTSEDPDYGRITEFDTLQVKTRGYMRHGTQIRGPQWAYVGGL